MIEKLILGTAGLGGEPYGRNRRAVEIEEAARVIKHALDCGITMIDTAPSYGFAEKVIGHVVRVHNKRPIIFTKTDGKREKAVESMKELAPVRPKILCHNWDGGYIPGWTDGVTAYPRRDLDWHHKIKYLDPCEYFQAPWNLFSQGCYWPEKAKFLARSVFLQGALAGDAPTEELRPYVSMAKEMASVYGVDLTTLALRAALQCSYVHGVLIGPTSIDEVDKCIAIAKREPLNFGKELSILHLENQDLADPRKWVA